MGSCPAYFLSAGGLEEGLEGAESVAVPVVSPGEAGAVAAGGVVAPAGSSMVSRIEPVFCFNSQTISKQSALKPIAVKRVNLARNVVAPVAPRRLLAPPPPKIPPAAPPFGS